VWQLNDDRPSLGRVVLRGRSHGYGLATSPDGSHLLVGTHAAGVHLVALDDDSTVALPDPPDAAWGTAFSPNGGLVAAGGVETLDGKMVGVIRVWNSSSLELVREFFPGTLGAPFVEFIGNDHVLTSGKGLLSWDLATGESELLYQGIVGRFDVDIAGRHVVFQSVLEAGFPAAGRAMVMDLESGALTPLALHGDVVTTVAMDAGRSTLVTGDNEGVIRVGSLNDAEPHLLLGRPDSIRNVAIDPKGRWIASSSGAEIRLWPMPDLSKPPLHTLPREELIAKLKTLTNLRVVRDEESATGWTLTHDPFPGWETVPTW
jgi:WD40 repeat protein